MPDDIAEPPAIIAGAYLFWSAYVDLQTERPPALYSDQKPVPQRIPWSAIANYARHHGLNVDELKQAVWAMDDIVIGSYQPPVIEDEDEDKSDD